MYYSFRLLDFFQLLTKFIFRFYFKLLFFALLVLGSVLAERNNQTIKVSQGILTSPRDHREALEGGKARVFTNHPVDYSPDVWTERREVKAKALGHSSFVFSSREKETERGFAECCRQRGMKFLPSQKKFFFFI